MAEPKRIVFHSGCPDGIIARDIVSIAGDIDLDNIHAFQYNQDVPDNFYYDTIWVDCCPQNEDDFKIGLDRNCIYLDHHNTIKDKFLKYFPMYPTQLTFGQTEFGESGAVLAYNYVKTHQTDTFARVSKYSKLCKLVGISDCFITNSPQFQLGRNIAGLISLFGNEFDLNYVPEETIYMLADALEKRNKERDQKLIDGAFITHRCSGYKIAIINNLQISDVAERLRNEQSVDLIVGFSMQSVETIGCKTIYSLRSNDRIKVNQFAKEHGGGGHDKAAGFEVRTSAESVSPYDAFLKLFEAWLVKVAQNG